MPVVAELELGVRLLPETQFIVVTGTKGKSTTTACIAHLLDAVGLGDAAARATSVSRSRRWRWRGKPAWLAVEASSFQLHDAPELAPAVGVLTNLSPDHLDRYGTVEAYYADKALLFRNATGASRWVINGDDPAAVAMASHAAGTHETFSLVQRAAAGFYDRKAGWLVVRGTPLMRRADLHLLGDHNVANALAAVLAVPPEADRERLARALATLPRAAPPARAGARAGRRALDQRLQGHHPERGRGRARERDAPGRAAPGRAAQGRRRSPRWRRPSSRCARSWRTAKPRR